MQTIWGSGLDTDLPGYAELQEVVRQRKVPFRTVSAGDEEKIGDARLAVLHPGPAFDNGKSKAYVGENDRSLVIRMSIGKRVLLFPGDIHVAGERALLLSVPDLACDLVKVPHHGSKTSSSHGLVSALHPAVAVATVGNGNLYRHPSDEVVERYNAVPGGILPHGPARRGPGQA